MKDKAFNKKLRALLESQFPWLNDSDSPADGGDTVDGVMEIYIEAGGKVAE